MAEIRLEDLPSNSHTSKKMEKEREKPEKLKPVVSKANVVQTKKSVGQKFIDAFIQDSVEDVKDYVIRDVIVPGVKNTILDCLSMIFFHESYDGRGRSRRYDEDSPSYSSYYKSGRKTRDRSDRRRREERYEENPNVDYKNIILKRREDAEDVVDELRRRIKKYERASVADLFDLIEVSGKYTDNNWGWINEEDIGIRRVSNGFLIDVAEAQLID